MNWGYFPLTIFGFTFQIVHLQEKWKLHLPSYRASQGQVGITPARFNCFNYSNLRTHFSTGNSDVFEIEKLYSRLMKKQTNKYGVIEILLALYFGKVINMNLIHWEPILLSMIPSETIKLIFVSVALSWSLFSTVVASQREIRFLLTSVLSGDPRVYCVKSVSRKELDATFCFHPLLGCNFSWFDYFWLFKKLIKNIKERKGS